MSKATTRLPTFPTKGRGFLFLGTPEGLAILETMETIVNLCGDCDSKYATAAYLLNIFTEMISIHKEGRCAPTIMFDIDESREPPRFPRKVFTTFSGNHNPGDIVPPLTEVLLYMSTLLANHSQSGIKKKRDQRKSDKVEYRLLVLKMREVLDLIYPSDKKIENIYHTCQASGDWRECRSAIPPYYVKASRREDTWG